MKKTRIFQTTTRWRLCGLVDAAPSTSERGRFSVSALLEDCDSDVVLGARDSDVGAAFVGDASWTSSDLDDVGLAALSS